MVTIQTYSGTEFRPLDPRPEDVKLIDIAQSLSNKCRYAGHTDCFYSVAQHSVLVSRQLPDSLKLWGLLHDAGEAYFADIPNPIKREFDIFSQIEDKIMFAVAARFGLNWPEPPEVKEMDKAILATEAPQLLRKVWSDYDSYWSHRAIKGLIITPWEPEHAREEFLYEFASVY